MNSKTRLTLILSLLALAIAGSALWFWQKPKIVNVRETLAAGGGGFSLPALQLKRGDALDYALSFSGQPEGSSESYKIAGTLSILVLEEESNAYRVALSLKTETTEGFDAIDPAYRAALLASFKEPVMAHLGRFGFDLQLDPNVLPTGMNLEFWQGFVDRTRVSLPEHIENLRFEQNESFFGERVIAHYVIDSDKSSARPSSEALTLQKTFTLDNNSTPNSKRTAEGKAVIVMNETLAHVEEINFQSKESAPALQLASQSVIRLRYSRQYQADALNLAQIDKRARAPRAESEAVNDSIQANVLGTKTFGDVWAGLVKEDDQKSYLLLKAWIQLHPSDLGLLYEQIKSLGNEDGKLRASIKALTAVGSEAAQTLLVTLLESHKGDPVGQRIASSLGFVTQPTPAVEKALEGLVRNQDYPELGRRAELALGGVGGTLRKTDAEGQARANALEKAALDRLTAAKDKKESIATLGMLGNLGPTEREKLSVYLQSPDPGVRGQAYFALRSSIQGDTSMFLVDAYRKEDPSVKKQILQALTLRDADANWFAALEKLMNDDKVADEDQTALAQALVRNARHFKDDSLRILALMIQKATSDVLKATLKQYQDVALKNNSSSENDPNEKG